MSNPSLNDKWNPYADPKPKDDKYNPYILPMTPTGITQQNVSLGSQGRLVPCIVKLDQVTRSRNAMLLALIVFVLAFLTSFIALMVFFPQSIPVATTVAPQTELTVQVISTKTDVPYDAALSDSNNYAFILMNTTMCTQVVDAARTAATIISCDAIQFVDASPGVKATMSMVASLDDKQEYVKFQAIANAIVLAAASDTNWLVLSSDVTLVPYAGASLAIRHIIQLPLLLCSFFIPHSLL